eukprot:SAG22_NODE_558_length_9115_cov_15.267524_3_plen_72_part_00
MGAQVADVVGRQVHLADDVVRLAGLELGESVQAKVPASEAQGDQVLPFVDRDAAAEAVAHADCVAAQQAHP